MKNKRQKSICKIMELSILILICIIVGPSKNVYAKAKNNNDVEAIKKIIEVQKKRGAKVSSDLNDKEQYKWNKKTGRLQIIHWPKKKLKGKINFNELTGLKKFTLIKIR